MIKLSDIKFYIAFAYKHIKQGSFTIYFTATKQMEMKKFRHCQRLTDRKKNIFFIKIYINFVIFLNHITSLSIKFRLFILYIFYHFNIWYTRRSVELIWFIVMFLHNLVANYERFPKTLIKIKYFATIWIQVNFSTWVL